MGRKSRGKREKQRNAKVDVGTLNRISEHLGTVNFSGELLPLCRPSGVWEDPTEFDREVCAAGVTKFLRPVLPGDFPAEVAAEIGTTGDWLLVTELSPGLRVRLGAKLFHIPSSDVNWN